MCGRAGGLIDIDLRHGDGISAAEGKGKGRRAEPGQEADHSGQHYQSPWQERRSGAGQRIGGDIWGDDLPGRFLGRRLLPPSINGPVHTAPGVVALGVDLQGTLQICQAGARGCDCRQKEPGFLTFGGQCGGMFGPAPGGTVIVSL